MKIVIPIIVTIVVVAVAAFVYLSPKDNTQELGSVVVKEDKMMVKEGSRYLEYSKANLDNTKTTRRVLFFYANWCPTCRPADASFSQNEAKIPPDITLIRVNYNDSQTNQEEKDLAAKYGVTYQHTYVQIDENGTVVTKWNGGQTDELLKNIR